MIAAIKNIKRRTAQTIKGVIPSNCYSGGLCGSAPLPVQHQLQEAALEATMLHADRASKRGHPLPLRGRSLFLFDQRQGRGDTEMLEFLLILIQIAIHLLP